MSGTQTLKQRLMDLSQGRDSFDSLALEVFRYQYTHNSVYAQYVDLLGTDVPNVDRLDKIPFLPIQFFKSLHVSSCTGTPLKVYESSGTTGMVSSKHYVYDEAFYLEVAKVLFEKQYGPLEQYTILALLPNYLERSNSSLVAMVQFFMKYSREGSGFFLHDFDALHLRIVDLLQKKTRIILWGVTFALLDFAESHPLCLKDSIVMETGGMKGRKKEMVREEVHTLLKNNFEINTVHSEYGMTELFSQAYATSDGLFEEPFSMKVLLREPNDPFGYVEMGKRGGINVVDLANIDSCSFIATEDLGLKHSDKTFEVLGRFDASDLRGCNLMVSG